jgi:hypothetical protein
MFLDFYTHFTQNVLRPGEVIARYDAEYLSVHGLGVTPKQFTSETAKLISDGKIKSESIVIGSQWPTDVFYIDELDRGKLAACSSLLLERKKLLSPGSLGSSGEIYTRALWKSLLHERNLSIWGITPKGELGNEGLIPSRRRVDVRFWFSESSGAEYRVAVETKNVRRTLYRRSATPIIARLVRIGVENDMQPMLMASFLAENTIDICRRIGIAAYSYQRQFVDSTLREEVKRLFSGVWEAQFQFVNLKRPLANPASLDKRSICDLEALRDQSRIEAAHSQWLRMTPWLPRIADALERGDYAKVDRLLGKAEGKKS